MQKSRATRNALALLVAAAVPVLAGCTKQDPMVVHSLPDDYRTRHPIVIQEKDQVLDLPVGLTSFNMTTMQRTALEGFMANYANSGNGVVTILVPRGSANAGAARSTANDISKFLRSRGISSSRMQTLTYEADPSDSAPIRISYPVMRASVEPCGQWPEDLANTYENRQYYNFGCSYQNNLAAQIANPADLLGPRKMAPADMANRTRSINVYQSRGISSEFMTRSEVNY